MQHALEDQLARRVLAGEVLEGDTVTFDLDTDGDGLKIIPPHGEVVAVGAAEALGATPPSGGEG